MSKTATSAIQQNKNLILMAVFGFGGMLTAILASIAVVTPLVNAQVNSALALQNSRNAQVATLQTQPVATVTSGCAAAEPQSSTIEAAHASAVHDSTANSAWNLPDSFKAAWLKTPSIATHTSNTTITTNNTTTNNDNSTHTTNKYKLDLTIRDSFNQDSYNDNSTNLTNSGNNSNNVNSGNIASGNTITDNIVTTVTDSFNGNTIANNGNTIASNNTITDNIVGNTVTDSIIGSTVANNGNTTNSNNSVLSDNNVSVVVPVI